jgi:hypothetical protein
MNHQIYAALELDPDAFDSFTAAENVLDYLAGDESPSHRAQVRELESFLWQRQSHVLGRADRL